MFKNGAALKLTKPLRSPNGMFVGVNEPLCQKAEFVLEMHKSTLYVEVFDEIFY